jgi:hypothetical protein
VGTRRELDAAHRRGADGGVARARSERGDRVETTRQEGSWCRGKRITLSYESR